MYPFIYLKMELAQYIFSPNISMNLIKCLIYRRETVKACLISSYKGGVYQNNNVGQWLFSKVGMVTESSRKVSKSPLI